MWTESVDVIRTVGASKLERYHYEAEVARALPGKPLRWRLAASLRLLADRLEPSSQGVGLPVAGSPLGSLPRLRA